MTYIISISCTNVDACPTHGKTWSYTSVTIAILNQLVILLVQNRTINVVNSLQLLRKTNETCTFVVGTVKGISLFLGLHIMQGSAMAINMTMCHSVCCEQTGRAREKTEICDVKYDTLSQVLGR